MPDRPPPQSLIHLLLDQLRDLQKRMNTTHANGEGMNVIEAYDHFTRTSNKGRACTYSTKCEKLFIDHMYSDIKQYISLLKDLINKIDV